MGIKQEKNPRGPYLILQMRCLFLLLILSSTSSFPDKLELKNAQERISLSQKESERRAKRMFCHLKLNMLAQTHFAVAKHLTEMFEEACVG